MHVCIYPTSLTQEGSDTRSVFKRTKADFPPLLGWLHYQGERTHFSYYLPSAGERIDRFIPFPRTLARIEIQLCAGVVYWPPTRPSCQKKKCTCVNNRCIRSKISGDQRRPWLLKGWIECEIVTLVGSRWTSNCYITPATWSSDQLEFRSVGVQISRREDARMRTMSQRSWALRPPVEQLRRTGKKRCYGHKNGGSICCSSVQSPTPLSQRKTFSNPFEPFQIKWEVYFSKELSSLVLIVLNMCMVAYVLCGYTT